MRNPTLDTRQKLVLVEPLDQVISRARVQSFHWTCVEPVASGWSGFFKLEICHAGENWISFVFDIPCVPR
jgi:hypothetical protein